MAALSLWGPLLFLVLVLHTDLGGGVPEAAEAALPGTPSLPLIQLLLSQAPPHARRRKQAGGQPLRYMLDLYRSVADRHGQPRRNRRLTTNAVRLVRPFAKARQPGAAGPWLVWHLDYRLEVQPSVEDLVRATVVYSRTLLSAHGPFRCTAELLSGPRAVPRLSLALPQGQEGNATAFSDQDGWVEVDLPVGLQPWAWVAQKKAWVLHLRHACAPCDSTTPEPGWEAAASLGDPFLLLYLNDTRRKLRAERGGSASQRGAPFRPRPARTRKARQAGGLLLDLPSSVPSSSVKKNECSLRPFRVSFKQLGWDHWIIAPHWYRPQYCKGDCPRVLRFGYHSPNHAIVQNLVNKQVDQSVPRPSCVPYEYKPISVLMIEQNGNILYKVYEDMIAKSCTCR